MSALVSFRAEVACGVSGCPWVIRVEASAADDGQASLEVAIKEHELFVHTDENV